MDRQRKREQALVMWEGVIKLMPTDLQVEAAVWNCQQEAREVAEELVEYIHAIRAFPKATKHEIFFEENK